jgi:chitinase
MALGVSKKDSNLRYIIQVKASRTGEIKYDADNVILCEIQKPDNFLNMIHVGFAKEYEHLASLNPDNENEFKAKALELQKNGKSIRQIAESIGGVSKSKVGRWLQPEINIIN